MIQPERIRFLNEQPERPERPYVVYWMQNAQRTFCNHALEYAIREANRLDKPVLVFFGLTGDFPEANARHYTFLLEGLRDVERELEERGIRFLLRLAPPDQGALDLCPLTALLVTDRGYLRVQRRWRETVARGADCAVVQVETDAVVPVETVSNKEEYAAATLRPKLRRLLWTYDHPLEATPCNCRSIPPVAGDDSRGGSRFALPWPHADLLNTKAILAALGVDGSVPASSHYRGGSDEAWKRLEAFIAGPLALYDLRKNDPGEDVASGLGAYLHFGQISPLAILQRLAAEPQLPAAGFVEELLVRRELSLNFVTFNEAYDRYEGLPAWAKATLDKHREDPRPYLYTEAQLEAAATHDPYWNAAQREMAETGRMHGYMRMYWGKKILEWSPTPEAAFATALRLNNKYQLDGRDPNSFTGVAWCFGKHDRPWGERPVFGMVRYMNDKGLKRKFHMDDYCRRVAGSTEPAGRADGTSTGRGRDMR